MKRTHFFLCALVLILACAAGLYAQVSTASLTGLVTDPSGAVVADARVTAKNKATNVEQTTSSDASGWYTFPTLLIGTYEVRAEKEGFKKAVVAEVELFVGQKGRLDFTFQLGAVAEVVNVEAAAPLLTTQEAATGSVVENRKVLDLPLSIRNWDDLLGLVAGVQADRYTEEGGGTAAGRTGGANVHGVRSLHNNFILDGVDNNSISENVQELSTQIARPSVDSIQEFKVTTSSYAAESGRSPGGTISVTTKSGTNSFHGVAYEFLRNREFDATSFFLNRAGRKKGPNVQNQYGGNLGGPIVKDKAFFFFNYEGTRIRRGLTRLGYSPMPNERIGDFSAAAATANRTRYDPIFDRVGDCVGAGNPFPNNQIPARCLDPIAVKVLGLVPAANVVPASGALNVNNFLRIPTLIDDTDSYTTREDWQINSKNNLFFRYTFSDRFRFVPGTYGGIVDGTGTSAFGRLSMGGQTAVLGWNSVLSARMVNEFRLGWGRNNSRGVQDPFGQNTLAELGILGVPDNPVYSGGIPGMTVGGRGGTPTVGAGGGLDRFGSPDFLPKFQLTNQWQWADNLSWSYGKHQFKFGGDLRLPMRNIYLDVPGLRGTWNFDGTRSSDAGRTGTGVGMADFLLGYPSGGQLTNLAIVDARLWMMSYFVQDDWKVTPKLTVNLGMRYDFATWPYEGRDRMTNLDLAAAKTFTPANSQFGRSLVASDKNNWSPRLGIAYQLTPKTVLRTGYGRFYQLFERAGSEDQLFLNLPWLVNNTVSATGNGTANNMRMRTGFNLSLDPNLILSDPARVILVRLRAVNPDSGMPSVDKWSFGLQRLLPGDITVSADYVGTKGTHLSVLRNLNQQTFRADGTGTGIVPYPSLGPIEFRENHGNSMYHGLDLSAEKRYSRGLAFGVAYTFSKTIDESMEHLFSGGTGSFTQNAQNVLKERRGLSDFDFRHRLVFNYLYELPFGRGRSFANTGPVSHIVGGWRLSGLTTIRSGRPFTLRAGGNDTAVGGPRGGGLINALADCLRDGTLSESERNVDRWFDSTAYAVPAGGRLGSCGRNTLTGPGAVNFDFALSRSFRYFGEGRSLEFRWEMFNMFNTPQFGLPERNISSSARGTITSLAADPRVMQFALKFYF